MTMLNKAAMAVEEVLTDAFFADTQPCHKTVARAVLMAIREPDDEVSDAGAAESGMYHAKVPRTFTAMIDHILNEEQNA